LKQHESDRERLSQSLKQHESELERLTDLLRRRDAEHQAAVEGLEQQIVEFERLLTSNDVAWKQRCEELASELTAREEERGQQWEEAMAELAEHTAERRRLSELLEYREAEQRRLIDEHAVEKVQIEQSIRGECERVRAHLDATTRREIDALRLDLQQLIEDLQGTAAQLEQRTEEYEHLMEEVTAPCDTSEVVDPADVERLMKSVAAYRVELVQVTENTIRTLEPMATAGRVAIASSRELQAAVEAVDARSRQLLEQCALDDINRPEIEHLRRDAIGAASLVRQLLQVFGDAARSGGNGAETAVGETP
jgi:hypothetical protein